MKTSNDTGVITKVVQWLEKHKIIRKLCIFWVMWLITVVVLNTTNPDVLKDVNGSVATIVTGVIGLFSLVLNALIKGDKER